MTRLDFAKYKIALNISSYHWGKSPRFHVSESLLSKKDVEPHILFPRVSENAVPPRKQLQEEGEGSQQSLRTQRNCTGPGAPGRSSLLIEAPGHYSFPLAKASFFLIGALGAVFNPAFLFGGEQ